MMVPVDQQRDSASLDGDGPEVQLPAYSQTDEQSNTGSEATHSPSLPTQMTAEQEKAHLADRDLAVGPPEGWREQYHTTSPTSPDIYEQPRAGDISTPVLFRGLQVPTSRRMVSSGFPYPEMLNSYGISPQEWSSFTSEITKAAKLSSKDWTITVGASAATFFTSGLFIGWLGLIPAIAVGHHLRRSAEDKNLRVAKANGELESKLLRWNQTTFAPRGFLIRLDLPGDESNDLEQMEVYTGKKWGRKCGGARPARVGTCCTRGRWADKAEKRAECFKRKTSKRGRIVIVPLQGGNRITTPLSAKGTEAVDLNPMSMSEKGVYVQVTNQV